MIKAQSKKQRPKLTDVERHKRFLETAEKVGASDNAKEFDKAFSSIVKSPSAPKNER
jgi:hypothetical protein